MGRLFITFSLSATSLLLAACGGHGHVNFSSALPSTAILDKRPAGFNMVLGSQALATSSNGYSAKIQLNELSGIKSVSTSGYTAKMRFTTRSDK